MSATVMERADRGSTALSRLGGFLGYLLVGAFFGLVMTKSEAISWFRIQEMFRFQSFHMYGLIFTAVGVAALSLFVLRRTGARALTGERIVVPPKELGRGYRYWIGGTMFGLGWALTGACPGPLFVHLGRGVSVILVVIASAVLGTRLYGHLRPKLPHY